MSFRCFILCFICLFVVSIKAQLIVKGSIVAEDSNSVLPFVYIINKSNGNGTMSDNEGRFSLTTHLEDTIVCSFIGFLKLEMPVKQLVQDKNGRVKLIMKPTYIDLAPVTVNTFRIKPYERQYMNDIIERSRINKIDYANSPISALYARYSREGKQVRKLAKIFEDLLLEEQVQKKLSREILTRLTGDDKIDYMAFRRYCYYVNDYYIASHDGVELYTRVMECYKRWKKERGE